MIVKFETFCAFAGTGTTHYVEVPDNANEEFLDSYLEDLISTDIEPSGNYEIITDKDELEEILDCYNIE